MAKPTYAQVSDLLKYDSETGKLFWKERPVGMFKSDGTHAQSHIAAKWNSRYANKEAFTAFNNVGYRFGTIGHRPYLAHAVIWLIVSGDWPALQIDHINGDKTDNRLINLREVTDAENKRNMKRPKDNTSSVIGVSWVPHCRKWYAYINVEGRRRNLGLYADINEAAKVRKTAEIDLGFHPNHGRSG